MKTNEVSDHFRELILDECLILVRDNVGMKNKIPSWVQIKRNLRKNCFERDLPYVEEDTPRRILFEMRRTHHKFIEKPYYHKLYEIVNLWPIKSKNMHNEYLQSGSPATSESSSISFAQVASPLEFKPILDPSQADEQNLFNADEQNSMTSSQARTSQERHVFHEDQAHFKRPKYNLQCEDNIYDETTSVISTAPMTNTYFYGNQNPKFPQTDDNEIISNKTSDTQINRPVKEMDKFAETNNQLAALKTQIQEVYRNLYEENQTNSTRDSKINELNNKFDEISLKIEKLSQENENQKNIVENIVKENEKQKNIVDFKINEVKEFVLENNLASSKLISKNTISPSILFNKEGIMENFTKNNLSIHIPSSKQFHLIQCSDGAFNIPTRYISMGKNILASGEKGITMLAHDCKTHKNVVIKKRKISSLTIQSAKSIQREFILSQIVKHKNVIELLNAFTPSKIIEEFKEIYFVFEFIQFPLSTLIRKKYEVFHSNENKELISYLIFQILCGLRHLHKTGIFHRDLTTSNILVNNNWRLKIINFGSARNKDDQKLTPFVGARRYRAPEIGLNLGTNNVDKIAYNEKVDVWSAGCILAEMFLGRQLFDGINDIETWNSIIQTLGTPNQEYINRLEPTVKKYVEQQKKYEPKPWEKIIPDSVLPLPSNKKNIFPELNNTTARDLLSKLLVIDPNYRSSVYDALEHPYVMWKHDPEELDYDINPIQEYNIEEHEKDLPLNEWKNNIFLQLRQYKIAKLNEKVPLDQNYECETCIKYRCNCSICLNAREKFI